MCMSKKTKAALGVSAMSHFSITSFEERIVVKRRVIAPTVVSPYTFAITASLTD